MTSESRSVSHTTRPAGHPGSQALGSSSRRRPFPGSTSFYPQRLRRARRLLFGLLAITWVPGLLDAALGVAPLHTWATLSGYTGLSWALPGLLTGLLVARATRARDLRAHQLLALSSGLGAGAVLLLGAATIIGA